MNRLRFLALLVVVLAGVFVYAQTLYPVATVQIPFEFTAGTVNLPAGDYTVTVVKPHLLKLAGPTESVYIQTAQKFSGHEGVVESKLIFTETNGQHMLHQVWIEGHSQAYDIVHVSMTPDVP